MLYNILDYTGSQLTKYMEQMLVVRKESVAQTPISLLHRLIFFNPPTEVG